MKHRAVAAIAGAALAILAGACGSGSGVATTGTTPTPVPTAGPVGVRALVGPDQPAPGVDVIFGDAAGTVLNQTQTDSTGQASFTMDAGGMITLLVRNPDNPNVPNLQTFTGLRPGDMVQTYASSNASPPLLGSVQIEFPERRLPDGTVAIQIDLGCQSRYLYPQYGDRLQGFVVDVFAYCPMPADHTVDVAVTALNGDFVPLAFSTSTGTVLSPSGRTPVSFPDGWRTDLGTFVIEYRHVSAGMTRLVSSVAPVYHGTQRSGYGGPAVAVAPGDSGARTLLYPDLADALSFSAGLFTADNAVSGPVLLYSRTFADVPDSATFDFATDVPPLAADVALTDGATVRPGATWSMPANLSNVDIGAFSIGWRVGNLFASWSVTFPPDAQPPLRVPDLPDTFASLRPPPDPRQLTLDGVSLLADSTVSGYHAYLASPVVTTGAGTWALSQAPPTQAGASTTLRAQSSSDGARIAPRWTGPNAFGGLGLKRPRMRPAERPPTP